MQPSQRNQHTHRDAHYGSTFQQCKQSVDFPLWALYQRYDTSVKDINWFLMVTLGDLSVGPPAKSPHYNDCTLIDSIDVTSQDMMLQQRSPFQSNATRAQCSEGLFVFFAAALVWLV